MRSTYRTLFLSKHRAKVSIQNSSKSFTHIHHHRHHHIQSSTFWFGIILTLAFPDLYDDDGGGGDDDETIEL